MKPPANPWPVILLILNLTTVRPSHPPQANSQLTLPQSLAAPTPRIEVAPRQPKPGSLTALLSTMAKDPRGALHLAPSGVLRSFAASGAVIDHRRAPEFAPLLRRLPGPEVDPDILGECSPPLACRNSTTCGGACGS
ncbi:hypothetical protein AK830_g10871, partial [Neonectria ditissima]